MDRELEKGITRNKEIKNKTNVDREGERERERVRKRENEGKIKQIASVLI